MRSIDVEGKTKDDALAKGLASLSLRRDQVSMEVLDEGGRGFLGLGGKPVRLRLRALEDGEAAPADVVRTLLELMDVKFDLKVQQSGEETDIRIDAPDDDGLLIGRRGQTLDALRHVSQRIIAARQGRNQVVNIDVGDYRARREAGLTEKAEEAARLALDENRSVTLDPMSAQDRRIVHLALADREGLSTYTVGRGSRRRVVVAPEGASPDTDHEDETAYDRVPDPGFRAQRMAFDDDTDPDEEAALALWREQERESEGDGDGEERTRRSRGRRGGRRGGRGRQGRRNGQDDMQGEAQEETHSHGHDSAPRDERPREREDDGERHQRAHRDDDRGPRRERSGRGRDDRRGRGPGRGDRPRRHEGDGEERPRRDAGGWHDDEDGQPAGPAITSKDELSRTREVADDSTEKAFPSDLARRILKLNDEGGAAASGKRRSRRR